MRVTGAHRSQPGSSSSGSKSQQHGMKAARRGRPSLITHLHASQDPPPELWQRGFPTTLLYCHSVEHTTRHTVDAR